MTLTTINHHNLSQHPTIHHASAVRKNNGKTKLYLCYFNDAIIIRNSKAMIKEIIRASDKDGLIAKLQKLKYQFDDGVNG